MLAVTPVSGRCSAGDVAGEFMMLGGVTHDG
jgi:hypothetical protein